MQIGSKRGRSHSRWERTGRGGRLTLGVRQQGDGVRQGRYTKDNNGRQDGEGAYSQIMGGSSLTHLL